MRFWIQLALVAIMVAGCGEAGTTGGAREDAYQMGGGLKPNVYGPGVHQNRYGQPVTVKPDYGGVPGEQLRLKQDAYGPGVHMDQYGRPVREQPWP